MPRPKKANTPTRIPTRKQVNVVLSDRTLHALHELAKDQRRSASAMARLILEDATGTAPE